MIQNLNFALFVYASCDQSNSYPIVEESTDRNFIGFHDCFCLQIAIQKSEMYLVGRVRRSAALDTETGYIFITIKKLRKV